MHSRRPHRTSTRRRLFIGSALASTIACGCSWADSAVAETPAWLNTRAAPDQRAAALIAQMTMAEKLQFVHSAFPLMLRPRPADIALGAGYVPGIDRLHVPSLRETDASLGVANMMNLRHNDVATALPASVALAATWNPQLAYQAGAMIGGEARAKRFNVMLAGGVNLVRDPRGGRTFEYMGEDPLLAGTMAGEQVRGIQSNQIISTMKHFALNDQESGGVVFDARIGEAAARESDLLAFEIALEHGHPGAVMTAYNRVNGSYASENSWLLNDVLKRDWGFKGWVMSDWGNVHSTVAAVTAGLDQQSAWELDKAPYFVKPLQDAVAAGTVPAARIDDMARRVLRSLIASGVFDRQDDAARDIDYAKNAEIALHTAEAGIVLLKNSSNILPLSPQTRSIVLIGGRADVGVLSGGGSTQVRPVGGPAVELPPKPKSGLIIPVVYDPSSPLKALQAALPGAKISFDDGTDLARATAAAKGADVAIVFAEQWRSEGNDVASLALPGQQEALIEQVTAANAKTIVVLESGGAVTMPWLDRSAAVVAAWFPGQKGGEAIAHVLTGAVNPSGRLPISFPASEAQLPRPTLPGLAAVLADPALAWKHPETQTPFDVDYTIEGAAVGYKWFNSKHLTPLFPFGYGLSYTSFAYSKLKATGGATITATLSVTNTGDRAGIATPQFYANVADPVDAVVTPRLIGWSQITLEPNQTRTVRITADRRLLAHFDEKARRWSIRLGPVAIYAGADASDQRQQAKAVLTAGAVRP